MSAYMKCLVCTEWKDYTLLKPCGHDGTCTTCISEDSEHRCALCSQPITSAKISTSKTEFAIDQLLKTLKIEENRALEETIQILIMGGMHCGKQTLCNDLLNMFPCLPGTLNSGPFSSKYECNGYIQNIKVRLSVNPTNYVFPGLIEQVLNEKPNLVVICGNRVGDNIYEEFLQWHNVVGGYRQFSVRWIVLPGCSSAPNTIPSPLFQYPPNPNVTQHYPDGYQIWHHYIGNRKDNVRAIGNKIVQAVVTNHSYPFSIGE